MEHDEAREQLSYIASVIRDSRRQATGFGPAYILWGALVTIASGLEYWLSNPKSTTVPLWEVSVLVGVAAHALLNKSRRGSRQSVTFAERIIRRVWVAALSMTGIAQIANAIDPVNVQAFVASILGMAIYLNGFIANLRLLRWVGICWWLVSLSMFAVGSRLATLVAAFAYLLLLALPGLIIVRQYPDEGGDL